MDWKTIKTKEFLQINEMLQDGKELNELDCTCDILEILTGTDYRNVPLNKYLKDVEQLRFLSEEMPTTKIKKEYEVNGHKYKLKAKIQELQTSQFMDYNTIMNDKETPYIERYLKLLAIFLIPADKENYAEGYDFDDVVDDMGDLLYIDACAIAFFLRKQTKKCTNLSHLYLVMEILSMKKLTWKQKMEMVKALTAMRNLGSSLR